MKKRFLFALPLSLLLAPVAVQAQYVVWMPIAEDQAKQQVGHQGFLTVLKGVANNIQDAGNDAQGIITTVTQATAQLHDEWYASLLQIGGIVRDYKRVKSMWTYQQRILDLYTSNITTLKKHPALTPTQIQAMAQGYTILLTENVQMLDDLSSILTPQMAKLDDADRMKIINKLAARMEHQYQLVSYFTQRNYAMAAEQDKESYDQKLLKSLYNPQ